MPYEGLRNSPPNRVLSRSLRLRRVPAEPPVSTAQRAGIRSRVDADEDRDRCSDRNEPSDRVPIQKSKPRRDAGISTQPKGEIANLSQFDGDAEMGVEAEYAQDQRGGHRQPAAAQ